MMEGGASSAEVFAETFRNTYGWNVMKPSLIKKSLWDRLYNVYIDDSLKLDVHKFFKKKNPYALQEITAVMLETVRKGYWKADKNQLAKLANLHATLIINYDPGCSGFVCNNKKLRRMIKENLDLEKAKKYDNVIQSSLVKARPVKGMKLNKEDKLKKKNKKKVIRNDTLIALSVVFVFLLIFIIGRFKRRNET